MSSPSRICPHCRKRTDERLCSEDGYKTVDAALYTDERDDPMVGTVFEERYKLLECIGSGGMGKVYRANQLAVDRAVAVKILRSHMAGDLREVARFQQEARALAALSHPNIIGLYDFGQAASGSLYLVMEFLAGQELSELTKAGKVFAPDEVVRIGAEMLDALADAHLQGVIHRDLKPQNIFLAEVGRRKDVVKLLDFGIAKVFGENSAEMTLTKTGMTIGSPRYMAPEQALGGAIGPATDLYSLGVILYEMLCGHPIFEADSPTGYVLAHVNQSPRWPARDGRRLEGPLVELIMTLLNKDPAKRGGSTEAVLGQLRQCAGTPVTLGGPVQTEVSKSRTAADPAAAIATAAVALADATIISQPLQSGVDTGLAPRVVTEQREQTRPRSRKMWWWAIAAVALLGILLSLGGDDTPASTMAVASGEENKAPALGSQVDKSDTAVGAGTMATASSTDAEAAQAQGAVEAAEPPPKLEGTLKSNPSGAAVLIGGTLVGKTPFTARWKPGQAPALELRLAGHLPQTVQLSDDDGGSGTRLVNLVSKEKVAAEKAAAEKAAAQKAAQEKAAAQKVALEKAAAEKVAAQKALAEKAAAEKAAAEKAAAEKAAAEKRRTKRKKRRGTKKKPNPYKRL